MKNMMSQVKNCSILVLCALLLLAVGCKKEQNAPEQPQPSQEQPDQPVTPPTETIAGNVAQPDWKAPTDYDMTSSMTAVVQVDLARSFSKEQLAGWMLAGNDMLAAFEGNTCLGVSTVQDSLFFLYITAPKEDNNLTLKYYSASVKNLFVATETLPYKNDDKIGSVAQPYTPKWSVVK